MDIAQLDHEARERFIGKPIVLSATPQPAWIWCQLTANGVDVRHIKQRRTDLYRLLHPDKQGNDDWSKQLAHVWDALKGCVGWVENPTEPDLVAMNARLTQALLRGGTPATGLPETLTTRLSMLQSSLTSVAAPFRFARLLLEAKTLALPEADVVRWTQVLLVGHRYYRDEIKRRAPLYQCRNGVTDDVTHIGHEIVRLLAHLVVRRRLRLGAWQALPMVGHSCSDRYHGWRGDHQAQHALALVDIEWLPYDFAALAVSVSLAVQQLIDHDRQIPAGSEEPRGWSQLPAALPDARAEEPSEMVYSWWKSALEHDDHFERARQPQCLVRDLPESDAIQGYCRQQVEDVARWLQMTNQADLSPDRSVSQAASGPSPPVALSGAGHQPPPLHVSQPRAVSEPLETKVATPDGERQQRTKRKRGPWNDHDDAASKSRPKRSHWPDQAPERDPSCSPKRLRRDFTSSPCVARNRDVTMHSKPMNQQSPSCLQVIVCLLVTSDGLSYIRGAGPVAHVSATSSTHYSNGRRYDHGRSGR